MLFYQSNDTIVLSIEEVLLSLSSGYVDMNQACANIMAALNEEEKVVLVYSHVWRGRESDLEFTTERIDSDLIVQAVKSALEIFFVSHGSINTALDTLVVISELSIALALLRKEDSENKHINTPYPSTLIDRVFERRMS